MVPFGHRRSAKRRVSSGIGSRPCGFIDMGHLFSFSSMGGQWPPTGSALFPESTTSDLFTCPDKISQQSHLSRPTGVGPCSHLFPHPDAINLVPTPPCSLSF